MLQKEFDPGYINIKSLLIKNDFAYISGSRKLGVLDISDPWVPIKIGEIEYTIGKIIFANDSLVFVDGYHVDNINVFNVLNPQQPDYICSISMKNYGRSIGFDSYIYTTSADSQLVVLDVKDPLFPISYPIDDIYLDAIKDAALIEDTLFLSDGNLHAFLIETPTAPQLLTSYNTDNVTGMIYVKYPNIYTADKGYMRIYNYDSIVNVDRKNKNKIITFCLYNCYPNPFNKSTKISYSLSEYNKVTLKIYDILGREAKTLVDEFQSAGDFSMTFSADNLTSGIYICKLKAGTQIKTNKILLIK